MSEQAELQSQIDKLQTSHERAVGMVLAEGIATGHADTSVHLMGQVLAEVRKLRGRHVRISGRDEQLQVLREGTVIHEAFDSLRMATALDLARRLAKRDAVEDRMEISRASMKLEMLEQIESELRSILGGGDTDGQRV